VYAQNTRFLQYEVHDMVLVKVASHGFTFQHLVQNNGEMMTWRFSAHFVLFMPTKAPQQLIR
jgi:hypothetical protein